MLVPSDSRSLVAMFKAMASGVDTRCVVCVGHTNPRQVGLVRRVEGVFADAVRWRVFHGLNNGRGDLVFDKEFPGPGEVQGFPGGWCQDGCVYVLAQSRAAADQLADLVGQGLVRSCALCHGLFESWPCVGGSHCGGCSTVL